MRISAFSRKFVSIAATRGKHFSLSGHSQWGVAVGVTQCVGQKKNKIKAGVAPLIPNPLPLLSITPYPLPLLPAILRYRPNRGVCSPRADNCRMSIQLELNQLTTFRRSLRAFVLIVQFRVLHYIG